MADLLNTGMDTQAGNIMGAASDVAGAIPAPYGPAIQAGLKVLQTGTNLLFGSNIDESKVAAIDSDVSANNSIAANASSASSREEINKMRNTLTDITNFNVGKDGVFAHKAKDLGNQKIIEAEAAKANAVASLNLATTNLESGKAADKEANFFKNGGSMKNRDYVLMGLRNLRNSLFVKEYMRPKLNPITDLNEYSFGGNLSTHGGDFRTGLTYIENGGTHEENPFGGIMVGVDQEGNPNLVEEGEVIYEDYVFSNRLKLPKSASDKYGLKGISGLTFADAAKKLSEEGKNRPNDPISKRGLKDSMVKLMLGQEELKMENGYGGNYFAKGGKINTNKYNTKKIRNKTIVNGYTNKLKQQYQNTIDSYSNNVNSVTEEDEIFTPEYTRVEEGMREGVLTGNKRTSGKVRINEFGYPEYGDPDNVVDIFDRKPVVKNYLPSGNNNRIYPLENLDEEPEFDISLTNKEKRDYNGAKRRNRITDNGDSFLNALDRNINTISDNLPENLDEEPEFDIYGATKDLLGDRYEEFKNNRLDNFDSFLDESIKSKIKEQPINGNNTNKYPGWLQYVGVGAEGLAAIADIAGWNNKADYGNLSALEDQQFNFGRIKARPISGHMEYRPFDTNYYINKLNAHSNATKRGILDSSSGNPAAAMQGLLAADINHQEKLGDLARQAEEYNLGQRQRVAEFNRATDQYNSQNAMQADMYNQRMAAEEEQMRYRRNSDVARLREAIRQRSEEAKNTDINSFLTDLVKIGMESSNRNQRNQLVESGVYGNVSDDVYNSLNPLTVKPKRAERKAIRRAKRDLRNGII